MKHLHFVVVGSSGSGLLIHFGLELSQAVKDNKELPQLFVVQPGDGLVRRKVQAVISEMIKYKHEERVGPEDAKEKIRQIYCEYGYSLGIQTRVDLNKLFFIVIQLIFLKY